jgi:hypothetical protein
MAIHPVTYRTRGKRTEASIARRSSAISRLATVKKERPAQKTAFRTLSPVASFTSTDTNHYHLKMRTLMNLTADIAARYLENLEQRSVAPSREAFEQLKQLEEPLPQLPMEANCVLDTLDRIGSRATMGMARPRFFGFVIGGSLPAALAANWLAGAWDQCPGLFLASPIGTVLEEVSLKWLLDVLETPRRMRRIIRNRRHPWPTSPRSQRHGIECWNVSDGTLKPTGCSALRPSPSWWEMRRIHL